MRALVLTVIGPDRPGLVEAIADVVLRHDANWIESRMSHLAGAFAGLLRVNVPADRAPPLIASLESVMKVASAFAAVPHTSPRSERRPAAR